MEHLGLIQCAVCNSSEELLAVVRRAAGLAPGPALALLPELAMGGFAYDRKKELAELTPELLRELEVVCRPAGMSLAGSFWGLEEGRFTNDFWLIGPELKAPALIGRKNHLFPLSREEQEFSPGNRPAAAARHRGVRLGAAVCFELRFPEVFREQNLQAGGPPEVFLVASQWPAVRKGHLRALCLARAIENQAYVLSCNAVGPSMLGELAGNSMFISPWGEVILDAGEGPSTVFAPLDSTELERARRHFTTRQSPWYRVLFSPAGDSDAERSS